jgi:predicted nucleotidyltransferase
MILGKITDMILDEYPATQAVYLFGSFGTEYERPESDLDLAVLLPHDLSSSLDPNEWLKLGTCLSLFTKRSCDLLNLRRVSTVFQFEIVGKGRVLYCGDQDELAVFEMLVISFYQELNRERKEILEDLFKTRRAYHV